MKPARTRLGNLIDQALRNKNKSQKEAAAETAINPAHLSMFMNGKRGLDPAKQRKLAKLLDIPAHEFFVAAYGTEMYFGKPGEPLSLEEIVAFFRQMSNHGITPDACRFILTNDNARTLVTQLWLGLQTSSNAKS